MPGVSWGRGTVSVGWGPTPTRVTTMTLLGGGWWWRWWLQDLCTVGRSAEKVIVGTVTVTNARPSPQSRGAVLRHAL